MLYAWILLTESKEETILIRMPMIQDIKARHQSGDSISKIARDLKIDRKTVRKYLDQTDFSPAPPVKARRKSKLDSFDDIIRGYLEEDKKAWRKQRHTATRIFERLRDEHGYTGSYETVQKRVRAIRNEARQMGQNAGGTGKAFLPLTWNPGTMQVDFGTVEVIVNGERENWHVLVTSFPHSNCGYAQLFNGETAECVCHGLRAVFEHIGGVPETIIFDNAAGVGRKVMGGVQMTELFERFALHYGFRSMFCNPYSGHEKGNVERKVFTERSHLFVPVPELKDIEKFNEELLTKSSLLNDKEHYKKGTNQCELLKEDLAALRELPVSPFNCCRYETRKTNKYGHIQLDGNHFYSTKPEMAQMEVIVEIGAHKIRILDSSGKVVAEHQRQFGKQRTESIDQSTTLAVLSQRPGAWMQSGVRQNVPDILQKYLDEAPNKERGRALRLLDELNAEFGFDTAVQAMSSAVGNGHLDHDSTMVYAARLADEAIQMPFSAAAMLSVYDMYLTPLPQKGGNE